MQGVRRDERHGHGVEPAHEHRAAVREVVGGRAGRRRADHPVAGHDAEILAADRPAELDHAAEDRARRDDVVDRDVPLAVERELERRQLDHGVLAGEYPREVALEPVGCDRRQKPDPPEVDADHGDVAAEQLRERVQDRPVSADGDRDVSVTRIVHEGDAASRRDGRDALGRLLDVLGAVRDDRGRANRPRPLHRSARRGHREASGRRPA